MKDRLPDWDERSNIIQEECDNEAALKAARDEIFGDLIASVQKLKTLRDSPEAGVALNAIKHHLKLAGLEVDRVHSNQTTTINILGSQAENVAKAVEYLGGVE